MGWTGIHATEYKNGRIDRKAQMDKEFSVHDYEVLKSTMRGAIYYAGVKHPKGHVFGLVCITNVNTKEYWNFHYKPMDESMLPYYYDCPKNILEMLSPTDSENANTWRERCYSRLGKAKPGRLPVGTVIRFASPWTTSGGTKEGDPVELQKTVIRRVLNARTGKLRETTAWLKDGYYRWTTRMIPENFEIVEV